MKNRVLSMFMLIVIVCFPIISHADKSKAGVCEGITLAAMQTQVPIPPATILSRQEVNGICEVILDINGQYVPVYAGKNFIIAGEMFQDKKQITQTRIDGLKARTFLKMKPEIEKCLAFSYAPQKNIKQKIYMITDPVCPFCHQAETQLKAFAEKNAVEFKIILASVHPPVGREKAIEAVCRKLSVHDYIAQSWRDENKTDQYQCREGIERIDASEKLASSLGLEGVPVFFLENGQRVEGADMPALESALQGLSQKVSNAK